MKLRLPPSSAQSLVRKLIAAGLNAADPYRALLDRVSFDGHALQVGRRIYNLSQVDRVIAVGAGKASARMGQALERALGPRLEDGLVIVKTGHTLPTKRIAVLEAGHPIPDRAGLHATQRLLGLVKNLSPRDLLVVLLSGGASSLLPAPVPGVTLTDKQRTTRLLLRSGATINEINVVRKHLSLVKGGGLASSTHAKIVTLILSDVIGDDLGSIGSGPTVGDPTTFADAVGVLKRYKIWRSVPAAVRHYLNRGQRGIAPETLKPGSRRVRSVHHQIIGNNRIMVEAVSHTADMLGLRTIQFSTAIKGDASLAAKRLTALAKTIAAGHRIMKRPCCVVAGGEPTVTVSGKGKGGRAQEFAAAAACEIAGLPNTWVVALGSDGTDGPTDAAGAIVSGETLARAKKLGVNLHSAVNRHDTYPALKTLGCHIHTGPTGTNVNDLYLLLLL
ncbi:MAG: glycerate kinase [Nitrospira sp.]|nr:glycerate kinase [Nitrospira sp.]MDH4371496.1 glycerate kinase [Nitrospira sp.]MDH5348626.1 glycerate kinase [Nitrospira sp.]MDH5499123.1 glycerate kinase [Nitrospira sp.]